MNIIDNNLRLGSCAVPVMSDEEFTDLSSLIYCYLGLNITTAKKMMLSSRLNKRLRELNFSTYREYYNYLKSYDGRMLEFDELTDAVTTNKTNFFRENKHFEFLSDGILNEILNMKRFNLNKKIYCWSAGCSTGEEPYTLAMILEDFLSQNKQYDFEILATDISNRALTIARNAIYRKADIEPIPDRLKKKYLLRGKNNRKGEFRIVSELREKVEFQQLNLMDKNYLMHNKMDIIFCRNVIIYFDRETQIEFFDKLYDQLSTGGYLFIGSSESLYSISDKFKSVRPTVYMKE